MRRCTPFALFPFGALALTLILIASSAAQAMDSRFTYQGELVDAGMTPNDEGAVYDFRFQLEDGSGAGGAFSITRDVIAAGGGHASAGPFGLTAVHGEPVTGEQRGGAFSLSGGFLHVGEAANNTDILLIDGFEASDG